MVSWVTYRPVSRVCLHLLRQRKLQCVVRCERHRTFYNDRIGVDHTIDFTLTSDSEIGYCASLRHLDRLVEAGVDLGNTISVKCFDQEGIRGLETSWVLDTAQRKRYTSLQIFFHSHDNSLAID